MEGVANPERVLLLNPPSPIPVLRDTMCGIPVKGDYYWPPLDLVVLSGLFRAPAFDLSVLDAHVERLDREAALQRIAQLAPELVISMTSAISWSHDMAFLEAVKVRTAARMVVTGDYALARPDDVLAQNACVDAVLLDYTDCEIVAFAQQTRTRGLRSLLTRPDEGRRTVGTPGRFSMPVPRHELFALDRYHLPQAYHHPFALLATDFGCAYECGFCACERIDYKRRQLDNLLEELRHIRGLGIRELRIMDVIFGTSTAHALMVCDALGQFDPRFSWSCEMRCDAVVPELLQVMRQAGCHTIMLGVESASEEVLRKHGKGITRAQIEQGFRLVREAGMRSAGYFIIGLTGETRESLEQIIDFSIALDPDFAAFSSATPLWNTSFRDELVEGGLLLTGAIEPVEKGEGPAWEPPMVSRSEMLRIRDRAMLRFYLRPSLMLRHILGLRTIYQFTNSVRQAIGLLGQSRRRRARG